MQIKEEEYEDLLLYKERCEFEIASKNQRGKKWEEYRELQEIVDFMKKQYTPMYEAAIKELRRQKAIWGFGPFKMSSVLDSKLIYRDRFIGLDLLKMSDISDLNNHRFGPFKNI